MLFTSWLSSANSCLEMALRADGRFKERTLMLPQCGAGTLVTLTTGVGLVVEYAWQHAGRQTLGLARTRMFDGRILKVRRTLRACRAPRWSES